MRLGIVAALALLASLPLAAAQVPDPTPVVDTACAAVGAADPQARDLIPLCPREDPAAPTVNEEPAAPAAPEPASPQDISALGREVLRNVEEIPSDPSSAGIRLLAIVATVVQFVKDLLQLPAQGAQALGDAFATAGAAVASAADGAREAAAGLVDTIKDLFQARADETAPPTEPNVDVERVTPVAEGLLHDVRSLVA